MIKLPDLPYKRDALEPHISKQTLDFHYGKHHKGYVDNLNKLIKGTEYEDADLEEIVKNASGSIFNNAAQVWNHTFFWNCMKPESPPLDPNFKIAKAIDDQFGNFETLREKFIDASTKLFGSGWVWLVLNGKTLEIKQTKNANTPLSEKHAAPLLVCDIWEHAYYLDYQNDRGKFVEEFFRVINWEFVEKKFQIAQ